MDTALSTGTPNYVNSLYLPIKKETKYLKWWIKNWESIDRKAHANEIYAFGSFFNITEEDMR